jgi:hypothetical protein
MGIGRRYLVAVVASVVLASGCGMASQADHEMIQMIHKARLNAEATAAAAAGIGTPTAGDWLAAQEWWAAEAAMWVALDDGANGKRPPMGPATDGTSEVVTTDVAARR